MSIQVNEFRHISGKNDAEYIKLLKEALERHKQITSKAIAKIKELSSSSESQNNWIPCSERLPEECTRILDVVKIPKRKPMVRSGYYANSLFQNDNGDTWNADDMEVIAWMPLPEPYKAESEEA